MTLKSAAVASSLKDRCTNMDPKKTKLPLGERKVNASNLSRGTRAANKENIERREHDRTTTTLAKDRALTHREQRIMRQQATCSSTAVKKKLSTQYANNHFYYGRTPVPESNSLKPNQAKNGVVTCPSKKVSKTNIGSPSESRLHATKLSGNNEGNTRTTNKGNNERRKHNKTSTVAKKAEATSVKVAVEQKRNQEKVEATKESNNNDTEVLKDSKKAHRRFFEPALKEIPAAAANQLIMKSNLKDEKLRSRDESIKTMKDEIEELHGKMYGQLSSLKKERAPKVTENEQQLTRPNNPSFVWSWFWGAVL